jgi:hypothetical protein
MPRARTAKAVLSKLWFVLSPVESYLLLRSGAYVTLVLPRRVEGKSLYLDAVGKLRR